MEWQRVETVPVPVHEERPTRVYVTMLLVLAAGLAVVFARASFFADWNGAMVSYAADGALLPATTDQIFEWGIMVMAVTSAILLGLRERGGRMLGWVVVAGLAFRALGFLKDLFVVVSLFVVLSPFTVLLLLVGTLLVFLALLTLGLVLVGLLSSHALDRHLKEPSPRASA